MFPDNIRRRLNEDFLDDEDNEDVLDKPTETSEETGTYTLYINMNTLSSDKLKKNESAEQQAEYWKTFIHPGIMMTKLVNLVENTMFMENPHINMKLYSTGDLLTTASKNSGNSSFYKEFANVYPLTAQSMNDAFENTIITIVNGRYSDMARRIMSDDGINVFISINFTPKRVVYNIFKREIAVIVEFLEEMCIRFNQFATVNTAKIHISKQINNEESDNSIIIANKESTDSITGMGVVWNKVVWKAAKELFSTGSDEIYDSHEKDEKNAEDIYPIKNGSVFLPKWLSIMLEMSKRSKKFKWTMDGYYQDSSQGEATITFLLENVASIKYNTVKDIREELKDYINRLPERCRILMTSELYYRLVVIIVVSGSGEYPDRLPEGKNYNSLFKCIDKHLDVNLVIVDDRPGENRLYRSKELTQPSDEQPCFLMRDSVDKARKFNPTKMREKEIEYRNKERG